jgi:hypothetical protein
MKWKRSGWMIVGCRKNTMHMYSETRAPVNPRSRRQYYQREKSSAYNKKYRRKIL